jgi:hypothetical protein
MPDFVVSVFRLTNNRGLRTPVFNVEYHERDSDVVWEMVCGGSRAYLVRFGSALDRDLDEQAAESHFMVHRLTSSLLLGGAGLFQAEAAGRLMFTDLNSEIRWTAQLDRKEAAVPKAPDGIVAAVLDWCAALCRHKILRRAADDAHLALSHPHEAYVFVYRGLEWLKEGLGVDWNQLARDIGVPREDLREFKKMANYETGVRHASKSGQKLRADAEGSALAVCNLFDAIWAARKRVEPDWEASSPEERSQAVMMAAPLEVYD